MKVGPGLPAGIKPHRRLWRQRPFVPEPVLHLLLEGRSVLDSCRERDGRQEQVGGRGACVDRQARVECSGVEHRGHEILEESEQGIADGITRAGREHLGERGLDGDPGRRRHGLGMVGTDGGRLAVGRRWHAEGVGRLARVRPDGGGVGARQHHRAVLDEEPVFGRFHGQAKQQVFRVGEAIEGGGDGRGIEGLPLVGGGRGSLLDHPSDLPPHALRHRGGKELNADRQGLGHRGNQLLSVGRPRRTALWRDDCPTSLLGDLERPAWHLHGSLAADLCSRANRALERLEEFVEILDRHVAVDHRSLTVGGHNNAQRPTHVEPGEPLELRGHHHERLGKRRERGVSHLRADPADLLLEVGIAVAGDHGHDGILSGPGRAERGEGGGGDHSAPAGPRKKTGSHVRASGRFGDEAV